MGCSCVIGAVIVLAFLGGGFYTGWMVQQTYAKQKAKVKGKIPGSGASKDSEMWRNSQGRMYDTSRGGAGAPLKELPRPGELRESMEKGGTLQIPKSSSLQMWYALHDDQLLLRAGLVDAWLGALVSMGDADLDPDLHSYTSELLSYIRMNSPNLLETLRRFAETGKLPDLSLKEVKALTAVLTVENILDYSRAPDTRHMQILAQIENVDKSKDTEGRIHSASSSLGDTSLTPKDRMERDFNIRLESSRLEDPRKQLEAYVDQRQNPQPSPYSFFPKICIPTVWHVLQFNEEGYTAPGNAYWLGDRPAVDLLTCANRNFELAGLPFRLDLSEYRNNVTQYPYLNVGSFDDWQRCSSTAEQCTQPIADKYNVDAQQVLNIYSAGTAACEQCCKECSSGYVSHIGDTPGIENIAGQHLVMLWDRVDPDIDNSLASSDKGCGTFTHEIAHILGGLYHTQTGNCTDGDMVSDTPANMDGNGVAWRADLSKWCSEFQRNGNPSWSQLSKFDSCKGDAYIDNVFNFMSYNPSSCRMLFTPGQAERMLENMYSYRPKLVENSKCVKQS